MEPVQEINDFRNEIEKAYESTPTGCGSTFDELLCWEIHENNQTFLWLAEKWSKLLGRKITVTFIGEVIADHCKRLEPINN